MKEVDIDGVKYSIGTLNCFQQQHVLRRIPRDIKALSEIPDSQLDYVNWTCLSVVQRQQNGAWAPLTNTMAGKAILMFPLSLEGLMALVEAVVEVNLGDFLDLPSAKSSTPVPSPEQK
jgi:hypothetical protein